MTWNESMCQKRWVKQTEGELSLICRVFWNQNGDFLSLKFIRPPETFGIFGILWIRKDSLEKLLTFPCVFFRFCLTYYNFWISAFSNFPVSSLAVHVQGRGRKERSFTHILIHQTDFYRLSISTWCWVKMKVAQLCPTLCLCDPMDYVVRGILQARILEWVAYPFSRASSQPRNWTRVSCIAGRFFTNWAMLGMQ